MHLNDDDECRSSFARPSFQNERRKQNKAKKKQQRQTLWEHWKWFIGFFLFFSVHFTTPSEPFISFSRTIQTRFCVSSQIRWKTQHFNPFMYQFKWLRIFFCLACNEWNSYCTHKSTFVLTFTTSFVLAFHFDFPYTHLMVWFTHMIRKCIFLFTTYVFNPIFNLCRMNDKFLVAAKSEKCMFRLI